MCNILMLYERHDHRSIYGIAKFKDANAYKEYISDLNPKKVYDELITQIYTMNGTIFRDYIGIKLAVVSDLFGLILFVIYLAIVVCQA